MATNLPSVLFPRNFWHTNKDSNFSQTMAVINAQKSVTRPASMANLLSQLNNHNAKHTQNHPKKLVWDGKGDFYNNFS